MPCGEPHADDASLVARIATGDQDAYAAIVDRHLDRAVRIAERMIGNRDEAEDAVQNAFITLWQRAERFDPARGRFASWFASVVANAAIDLGRRRREGPLPAGHEAADPAADAERHSLDADRQRHVAAALAMLPDRQRLAVVLCYFEGFSNAEAAASIGVGIKGLESLLSRARSSLRASLGERGAQLI